MNRVEEERERSQIVDLAAWFVSLSAQPDLRVMVDKLEAFAKAAYARGFEAGRGNWDEDE